MTRTRGADLAAFYAAIDCLALPSVNSTESFGLVQVEAMLCGTPVVASALPGVRQPVLVTGMGEIAPIGDAAGLAAALAKVLSDRERYLRPRVEIAARFDLAATAAFYERLYATVQAETATERGAMDRHDDGLGRVFDQAKQRPQLGGCRFVAPGRVLEQRDVGAGDEGPARAADDECRDGRVSIRAVDRLGEGFGYSFSQGVDGGIVDFEHRHVAVEGRTDG